MTAENIKNLKKKLQTHKVLIEAANVKTTEVALDKDEVNYLLDSVFLRDTFKKLIKLCEEE